MFTNLDDASNNEISEAVAAVRAQRAQNSRRAQANLVDTVTKAVAGALVAAGHQPLTERKNFTSEVSADTLCVLQGEIGCVSVPKAPPPQQECGVATRIMSSDATSCCIVAFRAESDSEQIVVLAHVDRDGAVVERALLEMTERCAAASSSQQQAEGHQSLPVEVFLVGSVATDPLHSLPILSEIFVFLEDFSHRSRRGSGGIAWRLRADGCAFWTLNTDRLSGQCITRGVIIDAADGSSSPAEFVGRQYAAPTLRTLRFCDTEPTGMAWISPISPEEMHSVIRSCEAAGIASPLQVTIVRPFLWPRMHMRVFASWPRDQVMANLSTTPLMEPPDFFDVLHAAFLFGASNDARSVFGNNGRTPLLFAATNADGWIAVLWHA